MQIIRLIIFIFIIGALEIRPAYSLEFITPTKLTLSFSKNDLLNYINNMHIKNDMFDLSYENKLKLYKNIKIDKFHYDQLGSYEKGFLLELRHSKRTLLHLINYHQILFKNYLKIGRN